jgi:hypothetical protein
MNRVTKSLRLIAARGLHAMLPVPADLLPLLIFAVGHNYKTLKTLSFWQRPR